MRKYISLSILSAVLVASAVALGDGSGPISGHVQTLIHFEGNDGGLHVIKPNDPLPVSESNSVTTASPKPTLVEYRSAVGSFCSIPDAGDAGCGTTLYDAGPVVVTPTSPLPVNLSVGSSAVSSSNPVPVQEQVRAMATTTCSSVVAATYGDGGVLEPTAGVTQELIVESGYGNVSMLNCGPCNAYGSGQLLNDGVDKYFVPQSCTGNDGGVPRYSLCAASSSSGHPVVQMCR